MTAYKKTVGDPYSNNNKGLQIIPIKIVDKFRFQPFRSKIINTSSNIDVQSLLSFYKPAVYLYDVVVNTSPSQWYSFPLLINFRTS